MTNDIVTQNETRMNRFGLEVAALLNDHALSHDISERLRVARQAALAHRKNVSKVQSQAISEVFASGAVATLGGGNFGWLGRAISSLPLLALVGGLMTADAVLNDERTDELADIDRQLLTDDLPPSAHTDPGFAQYLKFGPPAYSGQ